MFFSEFTSESLTIFKKDAGLEATAVVRTGSQAQFSPGVEVNEGNIKDENVIDSCCKESRS